MVSTDPEQTAFNQDIICVICHLHILERTASCLILTVIIFSVPGAGEGGPGGAMLLVNFHCRGVLLIWIVVEQGPTAVAVGAGGGCFGHFSLFFHFFFLSSQSLGDARY